MKNLRKIGALLLAVMMIAVVGLAFAAGDAENGDTATDGIAGNTNGVWAEEDTPVAQGNSAILYKEITAYNPATTQINAPTITYSYAVSAVSVTENSTEIIDAAGNHDPAANAHAYVKTGVGTPSVTTSLNLTDYTTAGETDAAKLKITPAIKMNAGPDGVANKYGIKITFNPASFTAAGVYRYLVTETATSYNSSGVVDGTIADTRYLDVYVKDAEEGKFEIYGYVCFENNNSIDASGDSENTVTKAAKTEGFVANTKGGSSGTTKETADEYYTFNLTIAKTLENDQAMNSNKFPFSLAFANSTVTGNVLPIVSGDGLYEAPTLSTAGAITSFAEDGTNLKIANGGSVTYTGIPVGTTVTINEQNNVTGTVYTTKTAGGTTNQATALPVSWNTWTNAVTGWTTVTALQKTANDNTVKADANMTVTFTNTLLQISPTGYVSRYAPYALILVAGIALLVLSRKRKPEQEEE